MSATPIWSSIAPALASAAPTVGAHTGATPQPGTGSVAWTSPLLTGIGLMAIGVICALALLVVAVLSTQTPPGLRRRWRRAHTRRYIERLLMQTQRAHAVGRASIGDATSRAPGAEHKDETVVADALAWRPLSEDIPGVGRIEWDPQTLRTFAGQPEVLYRLAFHRWRYQQGSLSEVEEARASRHEGQNYARRSRPLSKHAPASNEEDHEARQPWESSWVPHGASS